MIDLDGYTRELATLDELPEVRWDYAEYLTNNGQGESTIRDAQLVMTELVVNGFIHAQPDVVGFECHVEGHELWLIVSHEHQVTPEIKFPPTMPASTSQRGRGLAIVSSLAVGLRFDLDHGSTVVTAILRRDH